MTPESVRDAIHIVSSRSTAVFGFNTPLVRIYLPRYDNSAYAIISFDEPQIVSQSEDAVDFKWVRGGYVDKMQCDEIRFESPEGRSPIVFARVRGNGRIRYPVKIATAVTRKGEGASAQTGVVIDGPFVTFADQDVPGMAALHGAMGPIRAFDAEGRQFKRHGYNAMRTQGDITNRTVAFWGDIAEVRIDRVTKWAELAFTYDLPATKPLPDSYSGLVISRPPQITPTAGGAVAVTVMEPQKRATD